MRMATSMDESAFDAEVARSMSEKRVKKERSVRGSAASAPQGPDGEVDDGLGSRTRSRRWSYLWTGFVALVAATSYQVQSEQTPSGDRWDPDGTPTANWFLRPVEADRWRRPGAGVIDVNLPTTYATGGSILVASDKGMLLRTPDAGASWSVQRAPQGAELMSFVGSGDVLMAADSQGRLWRGGLAATDWVQVGDKLRTPVRAVAATPDGQVVLAVGDRVVLRSIDGGKRWEQVPATPHASSTGDVLAQKFPPEFLVARANLASAGVVSPDARPPRDRFGNALLRTAIFVDARTVLAAGDAGIFRSVDAGLNWEPVAIRPLQVTSLAHGGSIVLAASDGAVWRSVNGGVDWNVVHASRSRHITAVGLSPDGSTAIAVGQGGTLLRSDNGGSSWLPVSSGTAANLLSVTVLPGQKAIVAGEAGSVLRSIDGGQHWSQAGRYARYPAPWFDVTLALLVLVSAVAALRALVPGRIPLKPGLLDNAVSDRPVTKVEHDRLAFTPLVDALAVFLRHAGTAPPLAVAINAPWGMGKTSFMSMLSERLRAEGARPVWFNVWHHQHEDTLLAPLLTAITRQAIPSLWQWGGWRFRARLVARRALKMNWAVLLALVGLLAVPAYVVCLSIRAAGAPPGVYHLGMADRLIRDLHASIDVVFGGEWVAAAGGDFTKLLSAMIGALRSDATHVYWLLAMGFLSGCLYLLWTYLLRPFPANPAILVTQLNKRLKLSEAEAKTDFRQQFQQHFADVAHALAPRTLTVFIDDLDRCRPEKAAELLEAVNYLAEAGPCFVVLGMARELVEAQIASAHKQLAEEQAMLDAARANVGGAPAPVDLQERRLVYARKYLRKLVQLDVQLPVITTQQAEQLLLQNDAAGRRQERAAWWRRLSAAAERAALPVSLVALLVGLSIAIGWQWLQTRELMDQELANIRRELDQQVQALQDAVRTDRTFEQWLRFQADAARSTPTEAANIPRHRAHAELVAAQVKSLEAALPELEKAAREGRARAFENLRKADFVPHETQVQTLRDLHANWREAAGVAGSAASGALAPTGAASSPTAAGPLQASGGNEVGTGTPRAQRVLQAGVVEAPRWPLVLAVLPALLLLLAGIAHRDTYVIHATQEYRQAVAVWNPRLSDNPETRSPRELKRFMNLSRYVVARRKTDTHPASQLSESRIVEFTAKWLLGRASGVSSQLTWLLKESNSGADTPPSEQDFEEARWFLGVVGDISG